MTHYLDDGLIDRRTVYAIFADRIDFASDGRMNIFGIHEGEIVAVRGSDGYMFPGLDVHITVTTPAAEPLAALCMYIFFDEELVVKEEAADEVLKEAAECDYSGVEGSGVSTGWFRWNCRLPPRVIKGGLVIRARVATDEGVMPAGAVVVKVVDNIVS